MNPQIVFDNRGVPSCRFRLVADHEASKIVAGARTNACGMNLLIVKYRYRKMSRSLMMLALESNRVIALRCLKLMLGGKDAKREAKLMVSEKVDAAICASKRLMVGASGDKIVHQYRRRVAANAKRLGKRKRRAPRK